MTWMKTWSNYKHHQKIFTVSTDIVIDYYIVSFELIKDENLVRD